MKNTIRYSLLTIVLLISVYSKAQKKPYYNTQEAVIEAAYNALDLAMKPEGYLYEKMIEYAWEGTYSFNITIRGKGEVITVSKAAESDNIKTQNQVKNVIKEMKFPFKMPKNHSYKFKYNFTFKQ